MAGNCLERLVAALDRRQDCDIAHCRIKAIDDKGQPVAMDWYTAGPFFQSSGALYEQPHVRLAPYDGLLHMMGRSVYWSMTQLMFRRTIFDRVGMFLPNWGSMGDFNWNMRASLISNTVHEPGTWAGWRVHSSQATAQNRPDEFRTRMQSMVNHAMATTDAQISEKLRRNIRKWSQYFFDKEVWWKQDDGKWDRLRFVANSLLRRRLAATHYLGYRLGISHAWQERPVDIVRAWTQSCGVKEPLVLLSDFER